MTTTLTDLERSVDPQFLTKGSTPDDAAKHFNEIIAPLQKAVRDNQGQKEALARITADVRTLVEDQRKVAAHAVAPRPRPGNGTWPPTTTWGIPRA